MDHGRVNTPTFMPISDKYLFEYLSLWESTITCDNLDSYQNSKF
jgi:hypothetical protein